MRLEATNKNKPPPPLPGRVKPPRISRGQYDSEILLLHHKTICEGNSPMVRFQVQ